MIDRKPVDGFNQIMNTASDDEQNDRLIPGQVNSEILEIDSNRLPTQSSSFLRKGLSRMAEFIRGLTVPLFRKLPLSRTTKILVFLLIMLSIICYALIYNETINTVKVKKNPFRETLLCGLTKRSTDSHYCKSYRVADVLDLAWAVAPLYSCRNEDDQLLFNTHNNFISYLDTYGIPSITIEAIRLHDTNATYKMTSPGREPREMQSYFHNCSYLRENLLNIAIRRLREPWEYILWIDAHQIFEDPMWIFKAIPLAEEYASVQLFAHTERLDLNNKTFHKRTGFNMASFHNLFGKEYIEFGNAFILRRELYEKIGFIMDECLANDCDVTYCKAGYPEFKFILEKWFPNYSSTLEDWLNNAARVFNGSRTYLDTTLYHFYHQPGVFPFYELHQALEWAQFNRTRDLGRDEEFAVYFKNSTIAAIADSAIQQASLVVNNPM